jgi:hypothetical protein
MRLTAQGSRNAALTAASVCAVYPLALAGQVSLDYWFGDALLIRELQYGSARAVAGDLLRTWLVTLPLIALIWLGCALLRRRLRERYLLAAGATSLLLVCAATAGVVRLPAVLVWLLFASVVLDALARLIAERAAGVTRARAEVGV